MRLFIVILFLVSVAYGDPFDQLIFENVPRLAVQLPGDSFQGGETDGSVNCGKHGPSDPRFPHRLLLKVTQGIAGK